MKKKLLLLGLSLCLCIQGIPATAFASPASEAAFEESEEAENKNLPGNESEIPAASSEEETEALSRTESGEENETASQTESEGEKETGSQTKPEEENETVSEHTSEPDSIPETEPETETETAVETETETSAGIPTKRHTQEALQMVSDEHLDGIIQSGSFIPPVQKSSARPAIASISETASFEEIEAYIVPRLLERQEQIDISRFQIPVENIGSLLSGIINENPQLYFLENSCNYSYNSYVVSLTPHYSTAEYDDAAFQAAVEEALSLLGASMTDYEKALVLHDHLVLNCEYDLNFNPVAYNAYGALVEHKCVCQGYSLAYKYLLEKAGIESYMVTSDTMNHAWNMVVIDGSCYQTDVTWDDPTRDRLGNAHHTYFLISDAQMAEAEANKTSKHSDWVVQKNGEAIDAPADSTRFDDAYWSNVTSGILYSGDAWLYLDGNELIRRDTDDQAISALHTISDHWPVWGSSGYWLGTFSGLALLNGRLFFNTPTAIYSISTNGGTPLKEYAPDTSNGYLYGIALQNGVLKYTIKQNPGETDQIFSADLSEPEKPVFAVKFLDKDGKLIKTVGVAKGEAATAPEPPEVTGYEFTGWSEDFSNIQMDLTVQALYAPIVYTITYELNGGSQNTNPESYTIESDTIILTKPVREGYTFSGWFTDAALTEEILEISRGSHGDLTLYAAWKGTVPAPAASLDTDSIVDKNEAVSLSCSLDGAAVYYTLDGSLPDTSASLYQEPIVLVESCTLKAIAVKNGYFDSEISCWSYTVYENELILSEESLTLTEDEELSLSAVKIPETKTESDILWNSSDESIVAVSDFGVITAIAPGEAVITASITDYRDRTVTAECKISVTPRFFKVIFLDHNGNILSETEVAKGDAAKAPAPPDIIGYEFEKWDPDFSNVQSDLTVQAVYTAIVYKISYVLNYETENPAPGSYTIESDTIVLDEPVRDGYSFIGWFRDEALTQKITEIPRGSHGDITLYAAWKSEKAAGLRVEWESENSKDSFPYTGSAIKPAVRVFDGETQLVLNKDYSISYKNNTKVFSCDEEANLKKAPAIVIKGKGNYSGSVEKYFSITPVSLEDESITAESQLYIVYNKKNNYPVPTIMRNGKKLAKGTDFTVSYPDKDPANKDMYKAPGDYRIQIDGIKGYCGSMEVKLTILESEKRLTSKATVKLSPSSYPYTGEPVTPGLAVKYSRDTLAEGVDYEIVPITDCTEIGTHKIELRGLGDYYGSRTVTFKITGTAISSSNMTVTGMISQTFTGNPILQDITVTPKKTRTNPDPEPLMEGIDYEITQATGTDQKIGTYSILITGKGRYTGTIKKSFKVTAFDFSSAKAGQQISASFIHAAQGGDNPAFDFEKGGSRPKLRITFDGKELTEGTDYTLSYKNNTAVNDAGNPKKIPTVTIRGKGNFKGSFTKTFSIIPRSLGEFNNVVGANSSINAADVVTKGKKNSYQSTPVLIDENGKKLTAGTDYEKRYVYRDAAGNLLDKNSFPNVGDLITVTVTGCGNYTGSVSATYRILDKNKSVASATVTLNTRQYYTGEKICPTRDDLTVKIGKTVLSPDDYEIVGYSNNTAKGTATLTIRGIGEYGGTKTIKFSILSQVLRWFLG